MNHRTTKDVFEDHLRLRLEGNVEQDLARNYRPNVILLTSDGTLHGHDGVRHSASLLNQRLPNARFNYTNQLATDNIAFLEWTASSNQHTVCDGADSFLIQGGKILAQTIHYTVTSPSDTIERALK